MADAVITVIGTGTAPASGAGSHGGAGAAPDHGPGAADDAAAAPACGTEPGDGLVVTGRDSSAARGTSAMSDRDTTSGAGGGRGCDARAAGAAGDGGVGDETGAGGGAPADGGVLGEGRGTGCRGGAREAAAGEGVVVDGGAALVVGAARHVEAARLPDGVRRVVLGPLAPALDVIGEYVAQDRPVTVLASGDPGFFGIVRALGERFGPAALDVRPSSPSVAVAFARLGLSWDDAVVVSAHGRDLRTAVNVCRAHPKAAVLTGPGAGPAELGAELARAGVARTLVVAGALGTDAESVVHVTPQEAAARDWPAGVSVVLSLAPAGRLPADRALTIAGPAPAPAGWALPEEEFAHRDSMVTKAEVRALALARLGPRTGELVWDVGAGSGSVAVECARFGAAVVAVERDADGVARIRANAAAHGVEVQAVHGSAPAVLAELPTPDAVFVGGGGSDLPAIVTYCAQRARRAVVVTLAAIDRVPAVRAALRDAGLTAEGVLL